MIIFCNNIVKDPARILPFSFILSFQLFFFDGLNYQNCLFRVSMTLCCALPVQCSDTSTVNYTIMKNNSILLAVLGLSKMKLVKESYNEFFC